jgi:hypothetical protein
MEALKNEAQVLIAKARCVFRVVILNGLTGDADVSSTGLVDHPHNIEQGTFATTRGSHDGKKFSALDSKINGIKGYRFNGFGLVDFADVF